MDIPLLRFDDPSSDVPPELHTLPVGDVPDFLQASSPGPVVCVCDNAGLDVILVRANVLRDGRAIRDLGTQHVTPGDKPKVMGLNQSVRGVRDSCVAQRLVYRSSGRVIQGVTAFLKKGSREQVFLAGVAAPIFRKLAQSGVPPRPDRGKVRALQRHYAGVSEAAEKVRSDILILAPSADAVAIFGETGTGKELVARALHAHSGRPGPLVKVNCATIPESIAELELFGSVRGAGTDAIDRSGYFEAAHRGTIFLDEVGELSLALQAKLLRVIEQGEVCRLGQTTPRWVDVKVVAATNRDLLAMVDSGLFRQDLYQRLTVSGIRTPNLRDHREDFWAHVDRYWRAIDGGNAFPPGLGKLLAGRDWPGNVRQLQNFLKDLKKRCEERPPTRALVLECLRVLDGATVPVAPSRRRATPRSSEALRELTQLYATARGTYQDLEQILRALVESLVRELMSFATVTSRTKTVASLAERLQRDWTDDLFRDVRDLCGLRVIVATKAHKKDLIDALSRYVEIDLGPLGAQRAATAAGDAAPALCWLRIDERQVKNLAGRLGIDVPRGIAGQWAELQLRTRSEDAKGSLDDLLRRVDAPLPEALAQELVGIEGALERAERAFERLRRWTGSYGGHLTREAGYAELRILENTLACAPNDATIAARAGKLAMALGEFRRAIDILEPHVGSQFGPVLRDLGVALCQLHDVSSSEYRRGSDLLEQACRISRHDPEAFASLAGTCRRAGDIGRSRDLYRRALLIDDAFPYAVGGYLEMELRLNPRSDLVTALRPSIEKAINRCREEIQTSVGLPWSYFNLGKFSILLGRLRDGLDSYVEAIGTATARFMLATSLQSVASLTQAPCVPHELEVARRMLAIGLAARFPSPAAAEELASAVSGDVARRGPAGRDVQGPVVMLVGKGADPSASALAALGDALAAALRGFTGTLLSVGDLDRAAAAACAARAALAERARAVNYRLADVAHFSAAGQPTLFNANDVLYPSLAAWADVLLAEVPASSVLLLALGDEPRTAPDRRLALQLGAQVAVLKLGEEAGPEEAATMVSGTRKEIVVRDAASLRSLIVKLQRR